MLVALIHQIGEVTLTVRPPNFAKDGNGEPAWVVTICGPKQLRVSVPGIAFHPLYDLDKIILIVTNEMLLPYVSASTVIRGLPHLRNGFRKLDTSWQLNS